jgi:hypothetical protein
MNKDIIEKLKQMLMKMLIRKFRKKKKKLKIK